MINETAHPIPRAFTNRRLHSLFGIWLTVYIIIHLFTNSQAALWIGDDGKGFIKAVNSIQDLPYLNLIEILILAVPIIFHAVWGIYYMRNSRYSSFSIQDKYADTYLPQYQRNHAYTWQRITAWILLFAIAAHVIHMRFIERPVSASKGDQTYYMVKVDPDKGLYTLAPRLGVKLYDKNQLQIEENSAPKSSHPVPSSWQRIFEFFKNPDKNGSLTQQQLIENQKIMQDEEWNQALSENPLQEGQVIAVSKDYGTAELLMLRETFKMPIMIVLYTLFVLTACYHGFNGLWTFLITWGVTLSVKSQKLMLKLSTAFMVIVALLGLSAVWITYWINLKH